MDVQQVGANWRPGPPFTSPRINYYLQSILVIILALDTSSNLLLEPFPPTLSLSTPYFYLLELVWLATFAINPMSPRTHSSTSPVTASSMMHITISFMLLYLSPLLLRTLAYPTKSTELDTPAISTEAGRGDSDGLPDKSCDKGGANANTTGIDYSQGPPYVRFVLAYTDKNDIKNGTQDARVVVGIPSCTKWMKAKGSLLTELDSTYNSKSLQTMNMNKKSKSQDEEEESRKFCQSFRLRYTPNGRHNFQKAYVTTRFDPTSNIGWITSDNDKAPTWTPAVDASDTKSQHLFQCKEWYTKDGDQAYFGKGCLIKRDGKKGTCISSTNSLKNDEVPLQASTCPPSIEAADNWMLWNLQHVKEA